MPGPVCQTGLSWRWSLRQPVTVGPACRCPSLVRRPAPVVAGKELPPNYRRGGSSRGGGMRPDRNNSQRGPSWTSAKRRKGRPAWTRSPDDTPLRDGNRDRLVGLLTDRAARTLSFYLSETNLNLYHWLAQYMKENPIPRDGAWDDVSGETFLRKLLSMPIEAAKWKTGRDAIYDNFGTCGVDPRNIAQRIMDIRSAIAKEFVADLSNIAEENALLMRESITESFALNLDAAAVHPFE